MEKESAKRPGEMTEEEFKVYVMAKYLQGMVELRQLKDEAEGKRLGNRLKNGLWRVLEIMLAMVLYRLLFGN